MSTSSDTVIQIQNLSKMYRLGQVGTGTLAHDLNRWWCRLRGKEDPYQKIGETNDREASGDSDYVWALKDIDLEVKRGDRIGIIGRNGAGKSTLLKILSKVTGPTKGVINVKGRLASLLEVGTGMHPEMTGRENIYLNGAILGMTRREIRKKLDAIVDFAGVARYIDTPVKRYSSGMKVRLGFAVAAHLEPDILVVDEVLAVGDAEFQKKAVGKMQEVSEGEGRTILFVSHNMASVEALCNRCCIIQNGLLSFLGGTFEGINRYISESKKTMNTIPLAKRTDRAGNGKLRFTDFQIEDVQGKPTQFVRTGDSFTIRVSYKAERELENINPGFLISTMDNYTLVMASARTKGQILTRAPQEGNFSFFIDSLPFNPGEYSITLVVKQGHSYLDFVREAGSITVQEGYANRNCAFKGITPKKTPISLEVKIGCEQRRNVSAERISA